MKLLIVDDNKYVVEGLKRQLKWSVFGIDEVIGCYSVKQAVTILETTAIDFLISDIEMPGQNGFELLKWIREQKLDVDIILLTSYADFGYAQEAVRYQCRLYLLKPVETKELEEVFCALLKKRFERQKEKKLAEYGNNWISHQNVVRQMFWRDVLEDVLSGGTELLSQRIRKDDLDYRMQEQFAVVLVCFETLEETAAWSRDLLGFLCENVLEEISHQTNTVKLESVCYNGRFQYAAVFRLRPENDRADVRKVLEEFCHQLTPYYHGTINCYISRISAMEELSAHLRRLEEFYLDNLERGEGIYREEEYEENKNRSYQEPELEVWKALLVGGRMERLEKEVHGYFERLKEKEAVPWHFLQAVLTDWDLLACTILKEHHMTTSRFVTHVRDTEQKELSLKSTRCMEQLILQEACKIAGQLSYVEKTDAVIQDIRTYIRENISSVTRSQISEAFYLSPNYLSKLFRKETGESLSEYIQNERMSLAKQLLLQREMSISRIAEETGYPSFAYFSKQFKKFTGMTPNEYRKKR